MNIPAQPDARPANLNIAKRRRRRFASLRSILALMLREMATSYGRSPGGYLWAVLEPAAGIAILTLIFSFAFIGPPIGTSFPMFYATGMVPFLAYSDISNKVSQSLNFSRPLLAYPSVTFSDAILARFLLNLLTQVMVAYIIFAGLVLLVELTSEINFLNTLRSMGMVAVLSLGIGTFNAFLMTRFHIWQRVWGVLMRPMFILSCIFFVFDIIPQPYRDYLWYNPLVHVVGMMRSGFYSFYEASYVSEIYVWGVGLSTLLMGMILLSRYHRDLLNS